MALQCIKSTNCQAKKGITYNLVGLSFEWNLILQRLIYAHTILVFLDLNSQWIFHYKKYIIYNIDELHLNTALFSLTYLFQGEKKEHRHIFLQKIVNCTSSSNIQLKSFYPSFILLRLSLIFNFIKKRLKNTYNLPYLEYIYIIILKGYFYFLHI